MLSNIKCPILKKIGESGKCYADLRCLVKKITGQKLINTINFSTEEKPNETSLTQFFIRGAQQSGKIINFIKTDDVVLEYGGGMGRLGFAIQKQCKKLISVDIDPMSIEYGKLLCPKIEFKLLDEFKERVDFCYSIAVFFHLNFEKQKEAIMYVFNRLKKNGTFLLDLRVGDKTIEPNKSEGRSMGIVCRKDFIDFCQKLFIIEERKIFNNTFLLTKK